MSKIQPCVLTIAGSDSGGNAGVQADLRAFHCYGLHGCTVFAALTAQNPRGVRSVLNVPAQFVADQLDSIFEMYQVKALKTGMLATVDVLEVVAEKLKLHPRIKKVIDPVMVATSGAKLITDDAIVFMQQHLLPLATLITPNLPEAEVLLGSKIKTTEAMSEAARALSQKFGCAVLIKGGHAVESGAKHRKVEGDGQSLATDVLFDGKRIHTFTLPVIPKPISTHGTGCSLAAAVAAELAQGASLVQAVTGAKKYVYESIRLSYYIGPHCGVLGMPKITGE